MRTNLQENFYKRLKQLGGVTTSNNAPASLSTSTLIDYSRANDGIALGIVKENHNYFIKTSSSQSDKLGAEDFAYIGGVENKFKYQYNSLAEAEKNRNMRIKTLNETKKSFKKIAVNESENVGKAQTNGDTIKPEKAQAEADKSKSGEQLKDTAKEVEIAKIPAEKEISVEKQTSPKTVDATKGTSAKAIVVKKQTTVKVSKDLKEGEDSFPKPFPPSEEGAESAPAANASPVGAEGIPAEPMDATGAGDESSDIDAAASALDSMGAGAEAAPAEPSAEPMASTELGSADTGSNADLGMDDADASVKDIQKLNGKIGQKIRTTVLTPELTKGLLKAYITSFEDKLSDLDHEDRKELAAAILKDKSDADIGITDDNVAAPNDEDEKEIEETINAHLAEMGIGEDLPIHEDVKSFQEYMNERGYDSAKSEEISEMEMVSLVNGYTNECADAIENADVHGLAEFVTTSISDKVQESGNAVFENLMKPFGDKIKKNKKAYANEAVIPMNEAFGEDETEEEPKEEEPVADNFDGSDEVGAENEPATSIAVGEEKPEADTSVSFAPAGDTIDVASPVTSSGNGSTKSVTVDLNNNTVNMTLSESVNAKLSKIVAKKIEEQLNGKKSVISEGKKSALSIMIDELVGKAIQERRERMAKRLAK
jgi:hypothetical protein